jgi:hypothetical protein
MTVGGVLMGNEGVTHPTELVLEGWFVAGKGWIATPLRGSQ